MTLLPASVRPNALLRLFAGILVPLLIVGFIAEDVLEKERFAFETPLLQWVHAHAGPTLTALSVFLNTFGGPVVMGSVFVLIVLGLLILGGLYALLVGYSRLVLGVHYPTDVLAGWLTGLSLVLGAYQLLRPTLQAQTVGRPVEVQR